MRKEEIIKIMKIFSLFMILTSATGALVISICNPHPEMKSLMLALCIGLLIGGLIKIKYSIPYKYDNKDERDLVISLISSILSSTYFGVASFGAFTFIITKIVTITISDNSYNIAFLVIFGGTFLVDKLSYKILQRNY